MGVMTAMRVPISSNNELTRAGQPVHRPGAVVHRVEAPEPRHLVVRAVRPALHEIGAQEDEEERDEKRQRVDEVAHPVAREPAERADHAVGDEQREADHEVVHEEVNEIGLPLGAEDGLLLAQRPELLDEDEDQRRAEQVEDEEDIH